MAGEAVSFPPIKLVAGGHPGQLIIAVACMIAALLFFIFESWDALGWLLPLIYGAIAFLYRYSRKSAVIIFDDRVEFNFGSDRGEVVAFGDVISIEIKIRTRWANDYYLSVMRGDGEERILLPHVYSDVFSPLRKSIVRWYSKGGLLGSLQSISDGSNGTFWKAPRWRITQEANP